VIGVQARPLNTSVLIVDPKKHEIGRISRKAWSEGTKALVELLTRYIPNDEERADFGEAVSNDIHNSDYHLYCLLYR
jgi:hypothetical protein